MDVNQYESNEIKKQNSTFLKGLLFGVLISILMFGIGFLSYLLFFSKGKLNTAQDNIIDEKALDKAKKIQQLINDKFYIYNDTVSDDNVKEGIFRGMIASLGDPYSNYYSQSEMKEMLNGIEGVSYGIGCYVSINENGVAEISGTVEGSSAEQNDLQNGDLIVNVNGEDVIGYSLDKLVKLIKGPEGTTVEITFSRNGELITKTLTRMSAIETNTVVYGSIIDEKDIGYIQIKEFDDVTLKQYEEAYDTLKNDGMKALIIDLRNNPGGNLSTCVDIARKILPKGVVVYTEDKNGNRKDYTCDGKNELDIPLVVLVNKYSASASEILSGAIQDYEKGVVVGQKTFGKGIVQNVFRLDDGTAVKLTISSYFTPNGRNIHGTGIEPDVEVEYDKELAEQDGTDTQVDAAIKILKEKMGK
ncbi:MAG: S41 family peptidase [Lachnospiraceae bacterium]|nr:S41 family peptidase [Lachnospiraceae bacterium]